MGHLSQKNIFPYIWFDSYDRMSTTSLPACKRFKTREDCIYANVAWKVLGCKIFEDYHDMYLLADVVLLEREEEYIRDDEKPKKTSLSQILYLDVNGLYAHVMANCKLPYKLVHNELYDEIKTYSYNEIKELSEDDEHTYFLITDASVSELMIERNPALRYLPFFPVKINEKAIKKSKHMRSQCIKHNIEDLDTYKLGTVLDKTEKYMVHIKYLKLTMDAGYEVKKVHGYFKFA